MNQNKKLFLIIGCVILMFASFLLLLFIFKKKCDSEKYIDLSNTPIQPSNAFERGIALDRTTKATDVNKTWPLINIWPLTDSPVSSVRTYSFNGSVEWIKSLLSQNVKVFIGIDVKESIDNMFNVLKTWDSKSLSNIIAFSVANEPPFDAKNHPELIQQAASEINKRAKALKSSLNSLYTSKKLPTPPITACFVTDTFKLSAYKVLFESKVLDPIFCSNIYGGLWNSGNKPSTTDELNKNLNWGLDDIIPSQIKGITNTIKGYNISGSRLWITEVGWPSTPMPHTLGFSNHEWTTVHTEQQLYTGFLTANNPSDLLDYVFWFTIRDSNNETFGLYDSSGKSKFSSSPSPPPPPPPPSGNGYKDGDDIFYQNCSNGKKCQNPKSTICFNPKQKSFSCQPNCSDPSIKPDCLHNPPKNPTCKSVFCTNT